MEKKKRRAKLLISRMIPYKYVKDNKVGTINIFISINFFMEMKWTNFLNDSKYQSSLKKNHMNASIFIKETEFVETFLKRKLQLQMSSLVNSTKHLKKN